MAVPTVFLTGTYLNHVTRNPHIGHVNISPVEPTLADPTDDEVLYGAGDIALVDGGFRVALPAEGRSYVVKVVLAGNPRRELAPVTVTLDQADAEEVTEDDGEGGTVTFYEQDVTDFYTA